MNAFLKNLECLKEYKHQVSFSVQTKTTQIRKYISTTTEPSVLFLKYQAYSHEHRYFLKQEKEKTEFISKLISLAHFSVAIPKVVDYQVQSNQEALILQEVFPNSDSVDPLSLDSSQRKELLCKFAEFLAQLHCLPSLEIPVQWKQKEIESYFEPTHPHYTRICEISDHYKKFHSIIHGE